MNPHLHPDYVAKLKAKERMDEPGKRHGSQTFYKLLMEAADTHDIKSHDYASNENPYGNYHFAGQLSTLFSHCSQDAGFVGRIAEKLYRLANLETAGKIPKNESIEDTEKDLVVLMGLWMADRRDRRASHTLKDVAYTQSDESTDSFLGIERKEKGAPINQMTDTPVIGETTKMNGIQIEIIKLASDLHSDGIKDMANYLYELHKYRSGELTNIDLKDSK